MERRTRQLSRGYAALFASIAIWSMPSLFQFYLVRYYEPFAQNFYRYSVACLAIAPFVFLSMRREGPRIDIRTLGLCLIPCIPNVIHQITQVVSLFYMGPGVYAIFNRSSVIFTALLALAFFPEERHIIRQWQFQLGTLLGLLGAFGVIWFQAGPAAAGQELALSASRMGRHVAWPGLFIAFTATFSWALYAVLVKRPSAQLGAIRSFGVISFITSALSLPLTLLFGKIDAPFHAGAEAPAVVAPQGNACVAVAAHEVPHPVRNLVRCDSERRHYPERHVRQESRGDQYPVERVVDAVADEHENA